MIKQFKRLKIYIVYILCILMQPIFFLFDVIDGTIFAIVQACIEVKHKVYWKTRDFKSDLKMLDLL